MLQLPTEQAAIFVCYEHAVHYFVVYFYFVIVFVKMKVTVWLLNTLNALSCHWDIWCTIPLEKINKTSNCADLHIFLEITTYEDCTTAIPIPSLASKPHVPFVSWKKKTPG